MSASRSLVIWEADAQPGAPSWPDASKAARHILVALIVALAGLTAIVLLNRQFAPEMYHPSGPRQIAEALASGRNYAVFDLNLNIREIRNHHIGAMKQAPELVILGASHWQEAHAAIVPVKNFYNAHVHRDYYEDMLAMAEMFARHDRLPRTMIIAIRDNLFTPVAKRRDFLWLPGTPYYRAMAPELGIEPHGLLATLPFQRWKEQLSVRMLFDNVTRWYNAEERPHSTTQRYFRSLDTLLPEGSIVWSREHRALFTPERTRRMVRAHAASLANRPPQIDATGVAAIDALLSHLTRRGVAVVLAHPPFNPDFLALVRDQPYMDGLRKVQSLTGDLARKHGLTVIGSFDPGEVGCTADQYIDAEHANPSCLAHIFERMNRASDSTRPLQIVRAPASDPEFGKQNAAPMRLSAADRPELASQQALIEELGRAQHRADHGKTAERVFSDVVGTALSAPANTKAAAAPRARSTARRATHQHPRPAAIRSALPHAKRPWADRTPPSQARRTARPQPGAPAWQKHNALHARIFQIQGP